MNNNRSRSKSIAQRIEESEIELAKRISLYSYQRSSITNATQSERQSRKTLPQVFRSQSHLNSSLANAFMPKSMSSSFHKGKQTLFLFS